MGMWDDTVRILSLPDLSLVFQDKIEGNVVPRNVLFATLGPANKSYLLLAMGRTFVHSSHLSDNLDPLH